MLNVRSPGGVRAGQAIAPPGRRDGAALAAGYCGSTGSRTVSEVATERHMPLRYHVTTFGCQMNEHNSESMKGMLESLGYEEAAERSAAALNLFTTRSSSR